MKKIILLFSFFALLFSCSSDSENSSNNNGNSFTNSMDYEFTITINGEVHKVKGNTTDGIPNGTVYSAFHSINNSCTANNGSYTQIISLKINDVTESNYISGQNLECGISFPNLLLGINQASVSFTGSYFDTFYTNGQSNFVPGGWHFHTSNGLQTSNINNLPITISDLGSNSLINQPYPLPLYNFGQTLKGNYSGTIYLRNGDVNPLNLNTFDIPVQLSIDFKALRMY